MEQQRTPMHKGYEVVLGLAKCSNCNACRPDGIELDRGYLERSSMVSKPVQRFRRP
jgi:hypothetical protein